MPKGSNPNSRKNLRPPFNSETGRLNAPKAAAARTRNFYDQKMMKKDIEHTLGVEIDVPPELAAAFKKLGIKLEKRERLSKLIMHKALLKCFKGGEMKPLLDLAEFSGFGEAQRVALSGEIDNHVEITIHKDSKV